MPASLHKNTSGQPPTLVGGGYSNTDHGQPSRFEYGFDDVNAPKQLLSLQLALLQCHLADSPLAEGKCVSSKVHTLECRWRPWFFAPSCGHENHATKSEW